MSVSPRPTRQDNTSRPTAYQPAHNIENHNSNHSNANGTYLNPRNSELFRNRRSANNPEIESIPLIHTNQPAPLANPEMDLNGSEIKNSQPGIDDNFLSNRANEDGPTIPTNNSDNAPDSLNPINDIDGDESDRGRNNRNRGMSSRPLSPNNRGNTPFPDFELGTTIPELAESIPDINVYQHKKTLAQGMMDLALFSANANQLRYVLDSDTHPFYYSGIVLISISLLFQVSISINNILNSLTPS